MPPEETCTKEQFAKHIDGRLANTPIHPEANMFRRISDFTSAWAQESASTARLLSTLTDASLSTPMDPSGRSLGKIAWHLVETLSEMPVAAGLRIDPTEAEGDMPEHASEIAAHYQHAAALVGEAVASQWNDELLVGTTNMYGQDWARGFTLQCLILHQAHHRGQLTVLMRQSGLPVPGMVGPSREEWAAMGLPPQA